MKIKVSVPATSANIGSGFDALGLAVTLYNTVTFEESDHLDISAADGTRINALFHLWDLPDYASYHAQDCPLCRQGSKIDAVVTGNGYSSL